MSSLFASDDRYYRIRYLGWVSSLENEVGVRVDEVATEATTKKCSAYEYTRVGKYMPTVELFLEAGITSGAAELVVEQLLCLDFRSELICVPLDQLPG